MRHRALRTVTALFIATIACGATAQLHIAQSDPAEVLPPVFLSDEAPSGDDMSDSTASPFDGSLHNDCASTHCDCHCRDVCCPRMEEVTEQKSCWTVKCEKVCVPALHFPWEPGGSKLTLFSWWRGHAKPGSCSRCQCSVDHHERCSCSPAKCGRVRCVSVLEQEDYEVTTSRCQWEIRRLPPCGASGCGTSADSCASSVFQLDQ
jgi:hypothetical protein